MAGESREQMMMQLIKAMQRADVCVGPQGTKKDISVFKKRGRNWDSRADWDGARRWVDGKRRCQHENSNAIFRDTITEQTMTTKVLHH